MDIKNNKNVDLKFDLERRFNKIKLTSTKNRVADYIISDLQEIAFLTSDKLAFKVGTTPSTVVRFVKEMGFSGYPEFQNKVQEYIKDKYDSAGQSERAKYFLQKKSESVIYKSFLNDISLLNGLFEMVNDEKVKDFIEIILNAKKKIIIANRSSFPIGYFLYFELKKILNDVYFISNLDGCFFDHLRMIQKEDLVIAISFPRFSSDTIKFLEYSKKKRNMIISITNNKNSPLYDISDKCLLCPIKVTTFFSSKISALALVNAIICGVFQKNYSNAVNYLEEEDNILSDLKVVKMSRLGKFNK